MKAFIHGLREDGSEILGTGFPKGGCVTKEYKNIKSLIKHSLKGLKGSFHIEAFHNWDNRYKTPDIDIIVNMQEDSVKNILV